MENTTPSRERLVVIGRVLRLLLWLYLFMLSIKLMGGGFKTLGKQFDIESILATMTHTPLMGVCVGLIVTALVQSSSATTSILVSLVAFDMMDLRQAVPVVMGANLGTTITSFFVASAHVARRKEFRLAFSACTLHDIFNLLSVTILLPVEWMFHPLERTASWLTSPIKTLFEGNMGLKSKGPLNAILKPVVGWIEHGLHQISDHPSFIGGCLLVLALVLLFAALSRMVKVLKQVFMGGVEKVVHEYLFKRWWTALLLGTVVTALVQSSSMTVSLMVPMVAGGLLTLESAFPYTLGANIGTTVTAFLAAAATGSPAGISLALSHLLFNVSGTAIFLPLKRIPITISQRLADVVYRRRWLAFVFMGTVFFLIPLAIIFISRALTR